ncbi:hypothetical protein MLD38_034701 [Melastoma candidum]|uniref:Uncharacterized protein n=1 Tax=Melastoma candidum TaxID=119954 RepID=A0ACB9MC44_9MYRT|nr:hypothetical protein MLD38_034701 [Melastoma candidum]
MDPRRNPRSVIDPKVRHVGFLPPDRSLSTPSPDSHPSDDDDAALSPVIIPPPRHHSDNLSSPSSASHPVPPLAHHSPRYSEFSPRSPAASSPLSVVGSRLAADGEKETGGAGGSVRVLASSVPLSALTTASVVGVSRGITETVKGCVVEVQNEQPAILKPVKAKTTKAERRALQEAQRAAKAAAKVDATVDSNQSKSAKLSQQKNDPSSVISLDKKGHSSDRPPEKERKKDAPHPRMQYDDTSRVEKAKRKAVVKQTEVRNRVELFRHLPQYERGSQLPDLETKFFHLDPLHPAVYKVGLQYLSGDICGGNARCIAMLKAFQEFIGEKIMMADKVIVNHAVTKIRDGDVLLTYGSSSVVEMLILHAHELRKKFRVVMVDSRPKLEGQHLLRRLVREGISCTYTNINAISYIMHEVTRVFLGASAVLSNGTVYSRVGTACVAMVAHAFRVPVLVCCEAYKFHERVQLDSICCNELGDPDMISTIPDRKEIDGLNNWSNVDNLQFLNLIYDATPCDYVSMIITDYGMVPPTSVPVIVREYRGEHMWG